MFEPAHGELVEPYERDQTRPLISFDLLRMSGQEPAFRESKDQNILDNPLTNSCSDAKMLSITDEEVRMPRRTVTIAPGLDKAIRQFQAKTMLETSEDITYTEVLNFVLFRGLLPSEEGGKKLTVWKQGKPPWSSQMFDELMEGFDFEMLRIEGVLDLFPTIHEELKRGGLLVKKERDNPHSKRS